jgi:hypothetical protein
MTAVYNLRASNNATFRWTRDLTPFASIYNLAAATIRMQARTSPYAPDPPCYSWVTDASGGGVANFDPVSNLCVFSAPEADMARMTGEFVYDCRLEFSSGASIVIFGGRLRFLTGVTRLPADVAATGVSGIGDTVSVEGETGTSSVALPLSLSAAIVACQSAAASIAPTELAAALAALPASTLEPLMQALVASLPVYSGSGAAPVATGQAFFEDNFLVRAR